MDEVADEGLGSFFPRKFRLSPHDLLNAFQTIDLEDSPNTPGFIRLRSLKSALARFRMALEISASEVWEERPEHFIPEVAPSDAMIEWNDTRVFQLFQADLNVHEKLFFLLEYTVN
jgi:hypothetical protein